MARYTVRMWVPKPLLKYTYKGKVLLNENNPKNEKILTAYLKRRRLKAYWVGSLDEAKNVLMHKKILGVILDDSFRNEHEHTGQDLVKFIRREKAEELRGLPIFLVCVVETAVLQEYEYLKINRYFDTDDHRVKEVVHEMEPYFIERD